MPKKNLTYETAMTELRQILLDLQEQTVNMDDLSNKTARAAELLTFCREKLRQTEQETEKLLHDE